ncbi:MAG: SAM-dependent DNA methyltransferase, partial [Candidatus Binataceae bacterium]
SYFIPCRTEEETQFISALLNSEPAQEFYRAFVFWDAKRPITVEVLRRLDLVALAGELGSESRMKQFHPRHQLELMGS